MYINKLINTIEIILWDPIKITNKVIANFLHGSPTLRVKIPIKSMPELFTQISA